MKYEGAHTWDISIHYFLCPKCNHIIEGRGEYEYKSGKYQKRLFCERCGKHFIAVKNAPPHLWPLTGDPEPTEVSWSE